ncbi:MAG: putative cytokinetic ring protein SteA, partial [Solirubrobacterales bacterium]
ADAFELLEDGDLISISEDRLLRGGAVIATGHLHSLAEVETRLVRQRLEIDRAIGEFATNTIEHVREESELLSGEIDFPPLRTEFWERQVLIVVRGPDYREDLSALTAYVRDVHPVIVAVDGGADAVMAEGLTPDVILGDMDSATDAALRSGAELIVHAYHDGAAPGRDRLDELGVPYVLVPAAGTSQDVAMLLAHERGASLIVTVGAHFNLTEFLDKNRAGMSSTFLTRLRVGETLVDAKGVSRLYRPGLSRGGALAFAVAFLLLAVIVVLASPGLDNVFDLLWIKIRDVAGL